jgi:hypothetical protein
MLFYDFDTCAGGKLDSLYACVREVEHSKRANGLMKAVQARLTRRQLARIRYDGLIEYSTPSHDEQMADDMQWIMAAAAGPGGIKTIFVIVIFVIVHCRLCNPPTSVTNSTSNKEGNYKCWFNRLG